MVAVPASRVWRDAAPKGKTLMKTRHPICLTPEGIAMDDVARGIVYVEIVLSGAVVRHARELHALRHRKPLMSDERRGQGAGEYDLGEIS
jgi:hypothetical protein